jgi:hypothetical protein
MNRGRTDQCVSTASLNRFSDDILYDGTIFAPVGLRLSKTNNTAPSDISWNNETGGDINGVSDGSAFASILVPATSSTDISIIANSTYDIRITTENGTLLIPTGGGSLSANSDEDKTAAIGRGRIGYDGTNSDIAVISHYDNLNTSDYGLALTSTGGLTLNSASSTNIDIGGSNMINFETEITYTAPILLKSYDDTARDALTPVAGMLIYNTTDSEVQLYSSSWSNLDGPTISNFTSSSSVTSLGVDAGTLSDGSLAAHLGYNAANAVITNTDTQSTVIGSLSGGPGLANGTARGFTAGAEAQNSATTMEDFCIAGYRAAYNRSTIGLTAIGAESMFAGGGGGSSAMGYRAAYTITTTTSYGQFYGARSGAIITSGADSMTMVGWSSNESSAGGNNCTLIGAQTGKDATNVSGSVLYGYRSGMNAQSGRPSRDVAFGAISGQYSNIDGTYFGYLAGQSVHGSGNVMLGAQTDSTGTEVLAIGKGAVSNIDNTTVFPAGDESLALVTSGTALHVDTSTSQYGPSTSSMRFKNNISSITDTSAFYDLDAVSFRFNASNNLSVGFIAEDVNEVIPLVVPKKNNKPVSVKYDLLFVYAVAEMKKLHNMINQYV